MRQKSGPEKQPAEDAIRDIRRATRRHFSAEENIRVVLEGLRGEESIAEICVAARASPRPSYYGWSKEFLERQEHQQHSGHGAEPAYDDPNPDGCAPGRVRLPLQLCRASHIDRSRAT